MGVDRGRTVRGALAGLGEHLGSWPLVRLTDRHHPARDLLPTLTGSRRAFWQAAWRHLLFGALLGVLERRLNGPRTDAATTDPGPMGGYATPDGHGDTARTAVGHKPR